MGSHERAVMGLKSQAISAQVHVTNLSILLLFLVKPVILFVSYLTGSSERNTSLHRSVSIGKLL